MEDNKPTSRLVSFAKTDSKSSVSEEAASHGDAKALFQKEHAEQLSQTENSLVSLESTSRRIKRKSVKKQRKKTEDEGSVSESQNKKKDKMKEEKLSSKDEPTVAQIQKEPEKELDVKDKIKGFAQKGAAAKISNQVEAGAGQTAENPLETLKRRRRSSVIETLIRPSEDEMMDSSLSESPSRIPSSRSIIVKSEKREAEIMQENLLKEEQKDQAFATFVMDLVKKKRKEKEEAEEDLLTEAEIFEKSKNMSPLEQAAIICILEETIAKLSVLGFTHGKPVLQPEIKYVSLLDKLAEKEQSALIDLIKSNKSAEEHETEKHFIKLQKDRGFLEEALLLTLMEMKQTGTFQILQDIVHLEEEMEKEEADLRFEGKNRQQEVNHCKVLLESDYRKNMKKLDDRTAILSKLKDEIQNVLYYNGLKLKYLDHWESSRAEQNLMMLQNKEKELDRKFLNYEEMTGIELRCHAEMKAFIEEDIKNLSLKIQEWMEKYESELEEREYKISKLKEEREDHLKKLQDKTDLFNERQKQIDDWKAYNEKKRLEAEHKAYLNRMATRIQAWWKGTMVRRHLGPYKKKKGKHGKKGKKKKKK